MINDCLFFNVILFSKDGSKFLQFVKNECSLIII